MQSCIYLKSEVTYWQCFEVSRSVIHLHAGAASCDWMKAAHTQCRGIRHQNPYSLPSCLGAFSHGAFEDTCTNAHTKIWYMNLWSLCWLHILPAWICGKSTFEEEKAGKLWILRQFSGESYVFIIHEGGWGWVRNGYHFSAKDCILTLKIKKEQLVFNNSCQIPVPKSCHFTSEHIYVSYSITDYVTCIYSL